MADFPEIRDWLNEQIEQEDFRSLLGGLLVDMCSVDTIPSGDIAATADRERKVFDLIRRAVEEHGPAGRFVSAPISRRIAEHPAYSFPYYAGSSEAYEGRHNLLFLLDAEAGRSDAPGIAETNRNFSPVRHFRSMALRITESSPCETFIQYNPEGCSFKSITTPCRPAE